MKTDLLAALKEWLIDEYPPKKIIFDEVKNALNSFFFRLPNVPGTREIQDREVFKLDFEEKFWEEKLIREGGLKHLLSCSDDSEVRGYISFQMRQFYNKEYLSLNPEIRMLNADVKEILRLMSPPFHCTDNKYITKSRVSLVPSANIMDIENYTFSNRADVQERIMATALQIYEIIDEKGTLKYSSIMTLLKERQGKTDYLFSSMNDLRGAGVINPETGDAAFSGELENLENEISKEEKDGPLPDNSEFELIIGELTEMLTGRQRIIMVYYYSKMLEHFELIAIRKMNDSNYQDYDEEFKKWRKKIISEIEAIIGRKKSIVYEELKKYRN